MDLQQQYFQKFQTEKILVDVYTDYFEESTYGYIVKFNDDFILLEQFTSIGEVNGISIIRRENITRLRWEGNDISTTEKFVLKEKRILNLLDIKIDTITDALKSVQDKFGYISLNIQNIDTGMAIIGQIEEMDDETIVICEFGTYTSLDRKKLMMSINDISKIEAGGDYENNLKEIYTQK
ncbi:hypothetical protein [Flavobacterium sp.]|uniref:hypothetical protein n=1 Tax=Flavobacterium sp. TaxID=239 RepID=UPI002602AC61|nr:hypothetical protein [Flavobacterium sp.]